MLRDRRRTSRSRTRAGLLAVATTTLTLAGSATASAALVTPTVPPQVNPTCADIGPGYTSTTFDPPKDGTKNGITIDVHTNGQYVDWDSIPTAPVDVVIVKGGDGGNAYVYEGLNAISDDDLVSPLKNGALPEISHITFCQKPRGTVVITKDVDPGTDAEGFAFTSTKPLGGTTLGTFELADDGAGGLENTKSVPVIAGTYTVSETAEDGWTLKSVTCTDSDGAGTASSGSVPTRTATLVVDGTETVHCTFVNQKDAAPDPDPDPKKEDPKKEDPKQDPPVVPQAQPLVQLVQAASLQAPQPQPVRMAAPSLRVAGQARLQGPSGCVTRPFAVRIRGRQMQSVAFFVGSRRVRTVRAPDAGERTVTYRIDPKALRSGRVSRVTARVTFTTASGTSTRTLRLAVQRCRAAVAPTFTG